MKDLQTTKGKQLSYNILREEAWRCLHTEMLATKSFKTKQEESTFSKFFLLECTRKGEVGVMTHFAGKSTEMAFLLSTMNNF